MDRNREWDVYGVFLQGFLIWCLDGFEGAQSLEYWSPSSYPLNSKLPVYTPWPYSLWHTNCASISVKSAPCIYSHCCAPLNHILSAWMYVSPCCHPSLSVPVFLGTYSIILVDSFLVCCSVHSLCAAPFIPCHFCALFVCMPLCPSCCPIPWLHPLLFWVFFIPFVLLRSSCYLTLFVKKTVYLKGFGYY